MQHRWSRRRNGDEGGRCPERAALLDRVASSYRFPDSDAKFSGRRGHAAAPPASDSLDPSSIPRWYALRTRSRHEKKVFEQLVARRIETFLPLYERWSQWRDRRKKVQFPLFPGYCFALFPLTERLRVLTTFGVAGLVGINGPEPVVDAEIQGIRRLVDSLLPYDPYPLLDEGVQVEILRGPLAGLRGQLVRKDRSTRLVLSVTLIRQAVIVTIHPADVIPV